MWKKTEKGKIFIQKKRLNRENESKEITRKVRDNRKKNTT